MTTIEVKAKQRDSIFESAIAHFYSEEKLTYQVGETKICLNDVLLSKFPPPLDYSSLYNFSKAEYSEENVEFWKEASSWKKDYNARTGDDRLESAKKIYRTWISKSADRQVNLSSSVIEKLEKQIKSEIIPKHIFDDAIRQICGIIQNDILPRFAHKINIDLNRQRSKTLALWFLHLNEIKKPSDFFNFPPVINEAEARIHQILISLQMMSFFLIGWYTPYWMVYAYIPYGYFVRTLCGPRLCPNAWLVLFVINPFIDKYFKIFEERLVPSAPKRFTQFIGFIFGMIYIFGMLYEPWLARISSIIHIILALLAGIFNICVGCETFHLLENIERMIRRDSKINNTETEDNQSSGKKYVMSCASCKNKCENPLETEHVDIEHQDHAKIHFVEIEENSKSVES